VTHNFLTGEGYASEPEAIAAMVLQDGELRADVPQAPEAVEEEGNDKTVLVRKEENDTVWVTYVDSKPTIESIVAALENGEYAVEMWSACA